MPKPKADPRDYNADLRPDPPPKDATAEELHERVDRFVKNRLFGADAKLRESSKTK